MPDWNTADREKHIHGPNATLDECYRTGQKHHAYKWGRSPSGDWNPEQIAAYNKGYDNPTK